jgi:acyl-CoA dehydrogenase
MITFEPSEEQRLMRDSVAELMRARVRPETRATEASRSPSASLAAAIAELGLGQLVVPEALGGLGASFRTIVLVEEELGWADAGVAFAVPGPGVFAHALAVFGDAAQNERWLAPYVTDANRVGAVAFSERTPNVATPGFVTRARRVGDDWVLDGKKSFVLNADRAADFVVFAQTDEGRGWAGVDAFVVPRETPGLTVGARHTTLGLDAASFGEVAFASVRVGAASRLHAVDPVLGMRRFFTRQSLHVAARAVGVARAAWELARNFAEDRKAFGKPIGHFQAIAFALADRLMDLDGARGLVWRAAWALDVAAASNDEKAERVAEMHVAEAVAESLEVVMRTTNDGVQIHGGAGFVRDYLVEKLMRDAKQLALSAPSATTSDLRFATLALGAPLDPALVLPVPEIQPIFV